MDVDNAQALCDSLDDKIDTLESAIGLLLPADVTEDTVHEISGRLPILDRAKFYVTLTYALNSLIFASLKLGGVAIADHPVKAQLERVKQYIQKVKDADPSQKIEGNAGPNKRAAQVDVGAAGRIIAHGLAGNDKYDARIQKRKATEEQQYQPSASIAFQSKGQHKRFEDESMTSSDTDAGKSPSATSPASSTEKVDSDSKRAEQVAPESSTKDKQTKKLKTEAEKRRKDKTRDKHIDAYSGITPKSKKKERKENKRKLKELD